ncbi:MULTISPECIES: SIS domain-containing protein [Comamonadaceae]|uniref:SIS domain-containing protein n=1 Tax=Comamonadaceae TaxID=80864 RepID=UPI0006B34B2C|nr:MULTISPECIES: SIS domain-containing protein [Comamonadaceae]AVS60744.1 SIS domain-containing protein [Paracidovorax avenae]AVS69359.1 SIS domain-containing protein [Paracidovorax avenae]AVS76913.1 SIS domain-containing protein [Paracidovorax avenae]AVS80090.1 SIS domain-containing protein [Paracidovorax avenae]AVS83863.1 SIS domain-containing protein [Paracidovorax avenae]
MLEQRIQQHFIDSADLKYQAAQILSQPIGAAVQAILACVTSGAKVLACGSGAASAQARQFAALCVAGFERERPELAAVALEPDALWSAPGMPGGDAQVLARQVRALGQAGDVLLAVADGSAATDAALVEAIQSAHERDMTVIALTGRGGAALAGLLRETDVLIEVPHDRAARVREVHALVLHCLCDGVDAQLFGEQEIPL